MLIAAPSKKHQEKKAWLISWSLLGALFLASVWIFFLFFSDRQPLARSSISSSVTAQALPLDKIGWGPLGLNGLRSLGPEPGLAKDLNLLGRNNRPDADAQRALLLGLKSTGQEKLVKSGEVIFIERIESGGYRFSSEKTDLCIQPIALEGSGLLVEAQSKEIKGEFQLNTCTLKPAQEREYVHSLKSAKGWGPDVFLQQFGGPEYAELSRKYKIEIGKAVFYIAEGDLFCWNGQEWRSGLAENAPAARVLKIMPRSIQMEVWDETGFASEVVLVSLHQGQRVSYKPEELLSSVRSRSSAEFSALLGGKRRVVIKEGDWWLKTATGWKRLGRLNDIEDFIAHRLTGELFILEKVESDKAKTIVRGHHFDSMRTQIQPLSLTLTTDKKGMGKPGRDGRGSSSMIAKAEEKPRLQVPQFQNKEGVSP